MSFANLGLSAEIVQAVSEKGYTEPTKIQREAIPAILAGGDLLAGAQTGSGKTAGFTLPILHMLSDKFVKGPSSGKPQVRALIVVPTRELAAQVEECVVEYGKYLKLTSMIMIGGVSIVPQIKRLRSRVDILVATPGRLLDHVAQKTLDLSHIKVLVLDEADRMLDMGFIHDIKKILALLPKHRQNLLFSATFSPEIKTLAGNLLNNPALIEAEKSNSTAPLIKHKVHPVDPAQKRALLAHLIKEHNWQQVLVFTRTKHGANKLAEFLLKEGIPAQAIHGNKSQTQRTKTLAEFKANSLQVMVATDIAARGIDIVDLPHVVNFELPNVPEDYVHRIGRTGRAGKTGDAVSLVSAEEHKLQVAIERLIKTKIEESVVAGFEPSAHPALKPQDHTKLSANNRPRKPAAKPLTQRTGTQSGQRNSTSSSAAAKPATDRPARSFSAKPKNAQSVAALFNNPHKTRNKS